MTYKIISGWANPYAGIFNVKLKACMVSANCDEFLEKNEKFKKI
ncbi:MAG: hypothetical protein PHH24_01190 [Candidatus Moranbacteria bacterium]|jgi:hypothetical protein|nr:hypothetical protein [Candidatus Moranbacteria bacterium]MDD5652028.1 hypothetical protein [Candidatus Moranbacteria bacterium]MDX9855315.1 hypothetical protein [Candidatus Moranbacteria bacterium]